MYEINRVRKDFPVLERKVHGRRLACLDSVAISQEPQAVVVRRLKTARGHLAGIQRMVAGHDCREVMRQLAAVEGLVKAARESLLRGQLEALIKQDVTAGDHDRVSRDLLALMRFALP